MIAEESSLGALSRWHYHLQDIDDALPRPHCDVNTHKSHHNDGPAQEKVGKDHFSVGGTPGKDNSEDDVLELRHRKHSVVFVPSRNVIKSGGVERDKPRLLLNVKETECLEADHNKHVKEQGSYGRHRNEGRGGRRGVEVLLVRFRPAEENGEDGNKEKIDVEKLEVSQIAFDRVEDHD